MRREGSEGEEKRGEKGGKEERGGKGVGKGEGGNERGKAGNRKRVIGEKMGGKGSSCWKSRRKTRILTKL